MTNQDWNLWGAVVGSALGVAGGAFGCWMSIRATEPGSARRHLVKGIVIITSLVLAFTAGMLFAPAPWRFLLWIPYAPLLTLSIRAINRGQQRIREKTLARSKA